MTGSKPRLACALTIAIVAAARASFGAPSGLNDIPTTDTVAHRQLVLQAFYTTDGDRLDDLWIAFKGGLGLDLADDASLRVEYGLDSRVWKGDAGPTVAQFKLAGDLGARDCRPSLSARQTSRSANRIAKTLASRFPTWR